MSSARFLLVILIAIGIAATAHADNRSAAREHFQRGSKLFDLGRLDDAISEYEAAYELADDSVLLYNIAQAHRLAGHAQRALYFYKSYLHRNPRASNRPEVEVKIAELQKLIEQKARTETMPPDRPLAAETDKPKAAEPAPHAATEDVAPRPAPATGTLAPAAVSPPTQPAPPPPAAHGVDAQAGRTKRIVGIVLAAVGVAALAGAIGGTVVAKSAASEVTSEGAKGQIFDPSQEHRGQQAQIAAAVLYGVGGVAVASGVTLLVLGLREGKRAPQRLTVAPVVGPAQAGLSFVGTF